MSVLSCCYCTYPACFRRHYAGFLGWTKGQRDFCLQPGTCSKCLFHNVALLSYIQHKPPSAAVQSKSRQIVRSLILLKQGISEARDSGHPKLAMTALQRHYCFIMTTVCDIWDLRASWRSESQVPVVITKALKEIHPDENL